MATPLENSDRTFPPADIDGELGPTATRQVRPDPASSEFAASKERADANVKKEIEEKDAMRTVKSAIIIAGIVAVVAGASFAITKKLKEK